MKSLNQICSLLSEGFLRQVSPKAANWRACFRVALAICLASFGSPDVAVAVQLKPEAVAAFDRYVQLSEAEMSPETASEAGFLFFEREPYSRQGEAMASLRHGVIEISKLETRDPRGPIAVPGGMIHDWVAAVFIPGVTLAQTLALEEDYDHHAEIFRPDVMRSKILSHDGDSFSVYFRLHKKKIITSILDTDHDVKYHVIDDTHATSRSHTMRIQEVENAGERSEYLKPLGNDSGFLWRMNTYWRFEEKDGGTYVECRSISLTRDIPAGLEWAIGHYVMSIPLESLQFTLGTTRKALTGATAPRAAAGAESSQQ